MAEPRGLIQGLGRFGLKNPGWPKAVVSIDDHILARRRGSSPSGTNSEVGRAVMVSQNRCSRSSRCSRGLPAMMAPLMLPIETPAIQSGSCPASCSAW